MIAENLRHECAIRVTCNGEEEFGSNAAIVTKVRIARESNKGDVDVIAWYEKSSEESWNFSFVDYYGANGVEYTYTCTPYIGDRELIGVSATVVSKFDNLFIGNLYEQYIGVINLEYTHTTKFNRAYAQTYYSNYPHAIINGDQIYEMGNVNCVFMEFDKESCRFVPETAGNYKRKLRMFLATQPDKVLKTSEGDIWVVQVNGEVREGSSKQGHMASIVFDWTQVGDVPMGGVVIITSLGDKKVVMPDD